MHRCDQTDGESTPDAMRATEMMSLGREPYIVGLRLWSKKFDDLNFESELCIVVRTYEEICHNA